MPHHVVMQGDIVKRPSAFSIGKVMAVIIGVLVLIVLVVAPRNSDRPAAQRSVYTPAPVLPLQVHYEVEGDEDADYSQSASLTMQTPTGTSQQTADLPVENKSGGKGLVFSGFSRGDFLYLSAQNQNAFGSVTCRIVVDGVTVSENTSSGAYQIATCQGQA